MIESEGKEVNEVVYGKKGEILGVCRRKMEGKETRLSKSVEGIKLILNVKAKALLNFRHRASCILGQAFHYSPENAFYIFNQQIYFII